MAELENDIAMLDSSGKVRKFLGKEERGRGMLGEKADGSTTKENEATADEDLFSVVAEEDAPQVPRLTGRSLTQSLRSRWTAADAAESEVADEDGPLLCLFSLGVRADFF